MSDASGAGPGAARIDRWLFATRLFKSRSLAAQAVAGGRVHLNGERVLSSDSMFAAHRVQVGRLIGPRNELAIHCRALAPLLEVSRRPRARWRTALVANGLPVGFGNDIAQLFNVALRMLGHV